MRKKSQYCMKKGVVFMRTKYCIGFFAGIFLVVCLIGIGYQLSYRYVLNVRQEERLSQTEEESVAVKGDAEKNEGYYLAELHGYVVVYLSDGTTIYEFTDIPFEDLPKEVQMEVREQKYISSVQELYAFLENYSS